MAETEKGGLSSIDSTTDFSQKIRQQNLESQQILDAHRKRLMDLMSSRQQMPFDPSMMALAAGLLAPTKTGGFGESLSYGMTGYAAEAEKQFRREQEEAKLAYEIEMAAQEQKRKIAGQELFGQMISRKKQPPSPAPEVVPAPQTAPAASIEAPTSEMATEAQVAPEAAPSKVTPASIAPSATPEIMAVTEKSPDQVLLQVNKNDAQIKNLLGKIQSSGSDAFADISNEEIAMLEMYSPEYAKMINSYRDAVNKGTTLDVSRLNAFVSASKLELDKVQELRHQAEFALKERETIAKEASVENNLPGVGTIKMPMSFWKQVDLALKSGDVGNLIKLYKSNQLPINTIVDSDGKLRMMTPSEIDLKNKKAEARFTQSPIKVQIPEYGTGVFEMAPVDYRDYLDAKAKKDPDALQHWFNGSQFSGFVVPGAKIGTQFNSPELTRPAPPPAPVESPAAAPVEPAQRAPAPAPAPAPAAPVAQRAPAVPSAAPRRAPTPGKVLSAEELANIAAENELQRQIRLNQAKEEEATKQAGPKKRGEKAAEADVEFGVNMMKAGNDAPNLRIIAKDLKSIATSNPSILNIMQDTSITDALARTAQSGLQTPWGSISIDPKDLYIALDNYSEKLKREGKPPITKKDRDAYSLLLRNIAQLTVLERRLSRGEGQISDRETVLFQQVNLLPSDSALAVRLKSELMEQRANVTEKIGDAFYKYKKKTGGSYEDFTHSDEYKDIRTNYESKLDRIRDANARLLSNAPAPSSPQTALPPEAAKQLKQGEVTTFKNGQSWTIRDGKPVRVK